VKLSVSIEISFVSPDFGEASKRTRNYRGDPIMVLPEHVGINPVRLISGNLLYGWKLLAFEWVRGHFGPPSPLPWPLFQTLACV